MKTVEFPDIGSVKLVKSSGSRSIRLSVTMSGVRVSMPRWMPYLMGVQFVERHAEWLKKELAKQQRESLYEGQKIGKLHHLHFVVVPTDESLTSRVTATKVDVKIHSTMSPLDRPVQERAEKAVHRALKKETLQLLTPRLDRLAAEFGFTYADLAAKQLKRRWGSCDSHKHIVINFFLMDLPWELIDYVLLHELTHTEHMNHGEHFWNRLQEVCPRALDLKKQINQYRPIIQDN